MRGLTPGPIQQRKRSELGKAPVVPAKKRPETPCLSFGLCWHHWRYVAVWGRLLCWPVRGVRPCIRQRAFGGGGVTYCAARNVRPQAPADRIPEWPTTSEPESPANKNKRGRGLTSRCARRSVNRYRDVWLAWRAHPALGATQCQTPGLGRFKRPVEVLDEGLDVPGGVGSL
jgi:hypothetical protein